MPHREPAAVVTYCAGGSGAIFAIGPVHAYNFDSVRRMPVRARISPPLTEGEVAVRVRPLEVEHFGFPEDGGVAARRGNPEEHLRALGEHDASERHRPGRHATPDRDGGVVAQRLLYRRRDQRGVGYQRSQRAGSSRRRRTMFPIR